MSAARNPWGGTVARAAVLATAKRIAERDGVSAREGMRRALAWARKKASQEGSGDPYAALRARGVYSPLDRSADADAHFKRRAGQAGGSLWWGGR